MRLLDNVVGRVCIALITAMALLITGVGFTSVANAADIPDFNNIGDGTTSTVTAEFYKDNKGTPFDPATDKLKPGDTLYGKVTIKFSDEDKPTLDNLNISYIFPDNIDVKNVEEGDLYADGALAGTWLIKNNVAMFKYNEDWLKNHHSDISAYVNFDFTLNNNPSETGDGTKIHFPGTKGDVTIVIDKSELDGKKTWKLNDDGTVTFSVTLNNKFDAKNVVVTDTMGSNFVFRDGSFALDGTALPAGNVSISGQVAKVTLGDLKTGKHTLTYTADLSDAAKQTLLAGGKLDDAKNTAQWTWEGSDKPGEDDTTPNFSYDMISKKDGTGTADDIAWEVTLNSGDLKADMGGYVFTDTLKGGQHYKGTFEVVDPSNNWKVIDTGTIPGDATSFTYTFGKDAGKKQYVIRYHTKLDDPSSMDKVSNTGQVTPPDEGKPGGSDEGSFQPTDTKTYVTKHIDKNTATTDGKVEWSSLVKMSLMDKDTIPTKIEFIDNGLWGAGSGIKFDMGKKPVLTLGSKTLVEGTDYTLTYEKKSINIKFKDSTDIRGAIGSADVKVTYWTIGDTAPGYYGNTAQVKLNGKTTSASAQYNIEKNNLVEKSGNMTWDKNFKWSDVDPTDTTVGAWVATWTVKANIDQSNNSHGKVDVKGQPITITDRLPEGMSYVPGSATYSARTDWWPHAVTGTKITPTITGGTLNFSIDTNALTQADGTCFAYAEVTYKTVAKSTGKDVVFSNHAEAGSGSTNFGSSDATVKGTTKVIDKSGKQVSNSNHIKYTIKVNPQGADLIKNNDTLTLTDVMDAKATFVNSSLKITNSLTGDPVTAKVTVDSVKDNDGNPTTKLTIDLPDSTPITVEYEVIPSGKVGDKVHLSNTAQLSGVEQGSSTTKNDWTIHNAGAGTVGMPGTLQINKADASDLSRPLKGAKFELYMVDMSELPAGAVNDKQVRDASTKVLDGTTNVDGIVTFGSHKSPLKTNVLYFFVETAAPTWKDSDGSTTSYELDPSLHYVMLKGADKDAYDAALKQAKDHGITPSANQTYNVYDKRKPAEAKATAQLYAQKKLDGRAWQDSDSFDFKLAAVDNAPMPEGAANGELTKTVTDGSTFGFGEINYSQAGTYVYHISEVTPAPAQQIPGVSYSDKLYTATVTVRDNGTGNLVASVKMDETSGGKTKATPDQDGHPTAVIANTYHQPGAAKAELKAMKTLNNAQLKDGQFSFTLTGAKNSDGTVAVPMPEGAADGVVTKTNDANGGVNFGSISYDKIGTYNYTIAEVVPQGAANNVKDGITYDTVQHQVQVNVTLDKASGKLVAQVTYANDHDAKSAQFTNAYNANGSATLSAKKSFKNSDGSDRTIPENAFTFQLHEGATAAGKLLQAKVVAADGTVNFDPITYSLNDLDGQSSKDFTYTVTEATPANKSQLPGVAYDTASHTYTVTVTNDGNGKLNTVVKADGKTVTGTANVPVFTNTYSASGSTAIAGTKMVTGDDGKNYTDAFGGKFTFTLTGKDGAPIHVASTEDGSGAGALEDVAKLTAKNNADGTVTFGSLHYTLADLTGATADGNGVRSKTFTYEVKESGKVGGVTNDAETVKTFTVTVTDKGTGKLEVTTSPVDTAKLFSFKNAYAATAELGLTGTKTMTGRALKEGESYTFNVYEGTDTTGTPVSTGTSDQSGAISFNNKLTYSLKDLGDHTYTVVESEENLPGGVTAVTRTHTFTVNVADVDHNGILTLTTSGLEDKDGNSELAFKNNYATTDSTPIELKGVKLLEDGDYDTTLAQLTGKFTFTLKGENSAPLHVVDSDNTVADKSELTAKNDNAGNVNFGKVIYTFADLNGQTERTFTYTVTESGNVAGVTNDKTLTRTFTVTIKDNGDGTMSATADPASGPLFTFTNQYAAKSVTDSFGFTKRLDGRDLNDGEFAFTLTAGSGADGTAAPMPEGAKDGVATAKNTAEGKVRFGEITYAKPGTYTYTVRESAGDLGGVTYDDAVYTVTVTVVDNHDGTMSATHEITCDGEKVSPKDAVFENTYQPAPTTFAFGATKTLKGRALKDGEFRFELRDADGKTVETVKNSANGKVVFAPVTFDKAGEYTYTIREVAGKATGVAYDKTVYTAKVSVVDNLDGTMSATASYSSGLFGADHKAPAFENTYTPPLSETGSNTLSMGIAMILLLGGGLIMVLAQRKEVMGSRLGSQGRHSK